MYEAPNIDNNNNNKNTDKHNKRQIMSKVPRFKLFKYYDLT